MGTSKTASDNVPVPSDQSSLSMGTWSPNKQNHGGLSAAHLLALNSPEFNDHMHDLSPSTQIDATKLKVPGWTDLSEADEGRLIQRIEKWMDELSQPIDFDQVNGRLLSFQAKGGSPVRSVGEIPSVSPVSTAGRAYVHESYMEEETLSYDALVGDGGRPCCPYGWLRNLHRYKERAEHRDMLRAWCDEGGWLVYTKQLGRWNEFRSWQGDNRGILDIEADLKKQLADYALRNKIRGIDLMDINEEWQLEELTSRRNHEHHHVVERGVAGMKGEDRFSAYVQAAQTRLKRHGFTREFQPVQNHLQQDELTTWIEYLNYEYWTQDGLADEAAQRQLKYEQTLKALLDGQVLFPSENPEFVAQYHFLSQLSSQKDRDEQAMKTVESKVAAGQEALSNAKDNKRAPKKAISLAQLQERLKETVKSFTASETRFRLISDFYNAGASYELAKEEAEKHQLRLKWILDQVPLVQVELAGVKYATTPGGTRTRRPGHEGNLDDPDSQRHESHRPTPQEVLPVPGPPGQTHSSPSSNRSRRDVDEGGEVGPEGAAAKGPKLPDTQAIRGAQSVPELQEQALPSTPLPIPPSTLFKLKRTRSGNDSEEESEAPTAKRPKPNAQAVRRHQPGKEVRGTRIRQAPEGEQAEAVLGNEAAREEEAQRPADPRPTAATKQNHRTQPAASRVGQAVAPPPPRRSSRIPALVEARLVAAEKAAADVKAAETLPAAQSAAPRGKKGQPKEEPGPNSPQPAKPLPSKGRPKNVQQKQAQSAKPQPRKAPVRAASVERPEPGKSQPKKAQLRKALPNKTPAEKAPTKKAPAKKTLVKKQEPRKAQPKKSPPKKPEPKRAQR